jgi:PA domain-containing protein/flagellar hook capping protein FlgD
MRRTDLHRGARMLPGLVLAAFLAADAAWATTITIVNLDGAGEGFNDPTAAAPIGGNPGTTVGQQRLNVFQHAANTWASILPSTVTIRVQAAFNPLTCNATSAVLGSAGTIGLSANFTNAPVTNTWYQIALANKLAGSDLDPANNDINAQFNSSLNGDPGCLGGVGWYYGFDGNEGTNIDLLPVVLHEIGHGLGFATFTNLSTGAFFNGPPALPDIFSRFLFDRTANLGWVAMTNAQRAASAINTGNLVWSGSIANGAAKQILGFKPVLVVNSPGGIAGTYAAGPASFGRALNVTGVTGNVVLVDDGAAPNSDACSPLVNGAQVAGNIAFIDRGTCTFVSKAMQAQSVGAIAVIIANNVAGLLSPGGTDATITIPVIGISLADGNTIRAQLGAGVNATLKLDNTQMAGADPQGRVLMYAPNPLEQGSSVSHWDVTAFPNLLMEPALSRDLKADAVDLTRYTFMDIGWFKGATDAGTPAYATHLVGNYPNPFNPGTKILFELEQTDVVRLDIYDVAGRRVRRLVDGAMTAGLHALSWDGADAHGRMVATGIYVARLQSGSHTDTRRLALVK